MPVSFSTKAMRNPYPHLFDSAGFDGLISQLGSNLAHEVTRCHPNELERPSFGLCLMDPTRPDESVSGALLALITVGPDGRDCLPAAIAAAAQRFLQRQDCGDLIRLQPHRFKHGGFIGSHAVEVGGTVVGVVGSSDDQDCLLATRMVVHYNGWIFDHHERWRRKHPDHVWLDGDDRPLEDFRMMAAWFDQEEIGLTRLPSR